MTDVKQLPKEFLAEMKLLLGDEYHRYLKSFEEGWKPGLRVNTRKLEPGQLRQWFPGNWSRCRGQGTDSITAVKQGMKAEYGPPSIRLILRPVLPSGTQRHDAGCQLPVKPGDRVLDPLIGAGRQEHGTGGRLKGRGMLVSRYQLFQGQGAS